MAPKDDAAWFDLIRSQQPPFWSLMAEISGGSVERIDDVVAAIVPASPHRSVFNSVFYERTESLAKALPQISSAYEEAGVKAWTVWIPEADTEAAALLQEAGHVLDSEPRAMGMELADWKEPDAAPGVEITESDDIETLGRINEAAYGYSPGDFTNTIRSAIPDTHLYLAVMEGETVGTGLTWERGGDAEVTFIATLPEARGRGVGGEIMSACLRGARERGNETTTLQASRAGRPVYERIGYRDFGALPMWERRTEPQPK